MINSRTSVLKTVLPKNAAVAFCLYISFINRTSVYMTAKKMLLQNVAQPIRENPETVALQRVEGKDSWSPKP